MWFFPSLTAPWLKIRNFVRFQTNTLFWYFLVKSDIWSLERSWWKILVPLNVHPLVLLTDDDWYFYRVASGVLKGQWFPPKALWHSKDSWGKMTKKENLMCKLCCEMCSQLFSHRIVYITNTRVRFTLPFFWQRDKTLENTGRSRPLQKPALCFTCVLSFPLSQALVSNPDFKERFEKVEISPRTPHLHRGKVEQCGSYYLISIPYSQRYFNDLRRVLSWSWRWLSNDTYGACTWKGWVKTARRIFITQWHPVRRHCSVWWRRRTVFLSPRPLVSIMYLLFPSVPFIFRCLELSGQACVLPPPQLYVCTDGRQEGHAVYCFRLCGVPAVTDGLGRGFPWASVSVRSLAATSNHTLISLDQKQRGNGGVGGAHNIDIKIHLSPDVGHPSTAVSFLVVSHRKTAVFKGLNVSLMYRSSLLKTLYSNHAIISYLLALILCRY